MLEPQSAPPFARLVLLAVALAACADDEPFVARPPAPAHDGIYAFANGCYAMDATSPGSANTRWLVRSADGDTFSFAALALDDGARFFMRASDLGTYLFYDADGHYLVADGDRLAREQTLTSDVLLNDDTYRSPAEWELSASASEPTRFQLRNYQTGHYLTRTGLSPSAADAATVELYPVTGCAEFPEMTLDAEGEVVPRQWPDGDLFGIADIHEHLFTNFGFGGGGMFHGSPFHRLGVEHALGSCEPFHGVDGRRDLIAYAFAGLADVDTDALLSAFVSGRTPGFNHHTEGYPEFTDWPNSWASPTHQTQYYRWIERSYRGGVRLVVQHATTNSVLCEMMKGIHAEQTRYSCEDMVAVEREIAETYALERYVDAQSGGPGRGWLHVVTTPADARRTIAEGRLAVVLGIETSNLFECLLTPRDGGPRCTADDLRAQLDRYYALGVRALFPVHKFDNAFSAGDGDRNVGQLGSFVNSGHYSNFVLDCPDVPSVFDHGDVVFGGINMPRADYLAPAPADMSGFAANPLRAMSPYLTQLQQPPLVGDYCQNAGLTALGETLLHEMMQRGMLVEVDHMPRRAYQRAYEILTENDYPPIGSHGNTNRGAIFDLGGVASLGPGRCGAPDRRGAMGDSLRARVAELAAHGAYLGVPFAFDYNGFAHGPRPRFGPDRTCGDVPQSSPITYPFTSFAGDVTFTVPHLGVRTVDFNEQGMLHIGLIPEIVEDLRRDGVTDGELEPLFRSAEGYIRTWERAEARAAALGR